MISVQTVKLSDGATVSAYLDVTEMDTKLRKAQDDARAEFSKRGLYLREFSDRIARPVNTIAGSVGLLKVRGGDSPDLGRILAIIETSANELMSIHAQVLAFESHLREEQLTVKAEKISPTQT